MKVHVAVASAAMILVGAAMAKDKIVVVPAHPDDLIPCFGTCLLSKDIFEWHVIEFTHGERGLTIMKMQFNQFLMILKRLLQ